VVVLYLGFSAYAFLNSKDDVLKDDSDLRLSNIVVPASENAYFDFTDVAKNIETNNAKAVESYIKASTKTKFQDPAWADHSKVDYNTKVGSISSIRTMGNQFIAESKALASAGRIDEAVDKDFVVVRVGQLLNSSEDNLITWLVGAAIENMGLSEIARIKPDYKLPSSLLTNQSKKGLEQALKAEYMSMAKMLTSKDLLLSTLGETSINDPEQKVSLPFSVRLFNSNYYYKPHKTSNSMADGFRMLVRNVQAACGSQLETLVKENTKQSTFPHAVEMTENGLGKSIVNITPSSFGTITEKQCNLEALRNKLR
jgi:hypothetical protein